MMITRHDAPQTLPRPADPLFFVIADDVRNWMSPLGELIKMCVQLFTRWHDSHAKIMPDVHAAAVQRLNAKRGKEGLTHVHAHNHTCLTTVDSTRTDSAPD